MNVYEIVNLVSLGLLSFVVGSAIGCLLLFRYISKKGR